MLLLLLLLLLVRSPFYNLSRDHSCIYSFSSLFSFSLYLSLPLQLFPYLFLSVSVFLSTLDASVLSSSFSFSLGECTHRLILDIHDHAADIQGVSRSLFPLLAHLYFVFLFLLEKKILTPPLKYGFFECISFFPLSLPLFLLRTFIKPS